MKWVSGGGGEGNPDFEYDGDSSACYNDYHWLLRRITCPIVLTHENFD